MLFRQTSFFKTQNIHIIKKLGKKKQKTNQNMFINKFRTGKESCLKFQKKKKSLKYIKEKGSGSLSPWYSDLNMH